MFNNQDEDISDSQILILVEKTGFAITEFCCYPLLSFSPSSPLPSSSLSSCHPHPQAQHPAQYFRKLFGFNGNLDRIKHCKTTQV